MQKFSTSRLLRIAAAAAGFFVVLTAWATAGTQYVVANDDIPFPHPTGVSFFTVGADGVLVFQQQVQTGLFGIGGGFFGMNRLAMLNNSSQQCIYASEAGNNDIVGIDVSTLALGGSASGSDTDGGTTNGIGVAMNSNYLYASFSDSNTIGTFSVQTGCGLAFINDTSVRGVHAGIINGMAVRGTMLIATYTDGSIESFNISGGTPLSNGDKQSSTAMLASAGATYPNGIDITSDGHYAIFGDTSTSLSVEVSDISSGKLAKTKMYRSSVSISSNSVMLSPDETMLYVINTQGDAVSALFFDKGTGRLSAGCTSGPISGQSQNWSYLSSMGFITQTGNGGGVYVAEFGALPGIATVALSSSNHKCSLKEVAGSPAIDPNFPGMLSIGTFPPRSF
jgi:hypothetical protein